MLTSILAITRRVRESGDKISFCGFCVVRCGGYIIKSDDVKLLINGDLYDIAFSLKGGIRVGREFRLNRYQFCIPKSAIAGLDMQNKIDIIYKGEEKKAFKFALFDKDKGSYKNSNILCYDGKSIYLRQSKYNKMYVTVRDSIYFDSAAGRLKLFLGSCAAKFYPIGAPILLFEKEAKKYEESASCLYEKLISEGFNNVYFILDKNHIADFAIENKYKENIVYKYSLKHLMLFFKSKVFIGTETIEHAIELHIANRRVRKRLNSKNLSYVFLQHGVMYMVALSSGSRSFFHKKPYRNHKIAVSSHREADHFVKLAGFESSDLYVCGLPKFDRAYLDDGADKIVIMPTWRRWEINQATADFAETNYFKMMMRIMDAVPDNLKDKVVLLPHPLIIAKLKDRELISQYIPKGKISYDEVLRDCKLLITDYSSISYDAFYRGSNVIFYWEEKEDCIKRYGENAFLLLNEDNAFGDICYNAEELRAVLKSNYLSGQSLDYRKRYRDIVSFNDGKNTERLIKMLKDDGII